MKHTKTLIAAAIGSLFFGIAINVSAKADIIPPCPTPDGVIAIPLPDGLPAALKQTLHDEIGDIVLPGEAFDATDVVRTGHFRRFIFVWHSGERWIVATEHGGRGYNDPIFRYDIRKDGQSVSLIKTRIAFPSNVCSAASSLAIK